MEYIPEEIQHMAVGEKLPSEAVAMTSPAIIRRLSVTGFALQDNLLLMTISQLPVPISMAHGSLMVFGTEAITALEYFKRVIECGDMIDAVLLPQVGGAFPVRSYWIHIEYVGTPPAAGAYSKKDDGLFAMRAKAGEKAERVVTRLLRDKFGHGFPQEMCNSPGFFEIRYAGKKQRKPDRKCPTCGRTFEIKKRNKDEHFRVSHSTGRTFVSENSAEGWHAFVFPDMRPRFVPNAAIAEAIAQERFRPGCDQYDSWADIDPAAIVLSDPLCCP